GLGNEPGVAARNEHRPINGASDAAVQIAGSAAPTPSRAGVLEGGQPHERLGVCDGRHQHACEGDTDPASSASSAASRQSVSISDTDGGTDMEVDEVEPGESAAGHAQDDAMEEDFAHQIAGGSSASSTTAVVEPAKLAFHGGLLGPPSNAASPPLNQSPLQPTRVTDSPSASSEPAFYSLFDNPPNLGRIRQLLFEIKEPIEISMEEFDRYWPFVDNIWVKQRSNPTKGGLMTTDYYMCRLRRPSSRSSQSAAPSEPGLTPSPASPSAVATETAKSATSPAATAAAAEAALPVPVPGSGSGGDASSAPANTAGGTAKKPRNKKRREGSTCNVQIKVVRFEGAYTTVTISKTPGSSRAHSHDLDYIDKVKRNSGLLEYAKKEARKGYLPSSIYAKFREEPQLLLDAGGRFLTITDVRNISAKWRSLYPTATLKTHEGYAYHQGYGVVRIAGLKDGSQAKGTTFATGPIPEQPSQPQLAPDALPFPDYDLSFLNPYLPKDEARDFPHVTLSYACSLDAKISLSPGMMTLLSGPKSKLMTHYLRSRHDAVIIGIGTALADDPGLNCRLDGAGGYGGLGRMWQPRPIIVDPTGRWAADPACKMLQFARQGKGKAPWIVISPGANIAPEKLVVLKGHGGDYLRIVEYNQNWLLRWEAIFRALAAEGIKSVMVEGGGTVMSELLNPEYRELVDSIVVTVAPTYLGAGGVAVSPDSKKDESGNPVNALSPREIKWQPLGQDVIMCGKIRGDTAQQRSASAAP
ncbi:2,5-diamino-6-(ribosylamino)-4(3H)-pyrimidinone 5'-phosphate reductase, partial [Ascosphaera acerosa]